MAKFKRILLKLSGESLMGKQSFGIDPERLSDYAKQIKEVHEMGVQIGIVIGGGNIFRVKNLKEYMNVPMVHWKQNLQVTTINQNIIMSLLIQYRY